MLLGKYTINTLNYVCIMVYKPVALNVWTAAPLGLGGLLHRGRLGPSEDINILHYDL